MSRRGPKNRANRAAKRKTTCVYCGRQATCTDEHVIPQCLFPEGGRPPKSDFQIVPACPSCNGLKSREDSYIRDVFTADAACEGNPVVRAVLKPVFRSIEKNRSDFGRTAKKRTRVVEVRTPSGLYLGYRPAIPIEWDRISRFFEWVVRGLYWVAMGGQRLPDDCKFQVIRLNTTDAISGRLRHFNEHNAFGPFGIGVGVVEWRRLVVQEDTRMTNWLFKFYNSIYIKAATCPLEEAALFESCGANFSPSLYA